MVGINDVLDKGEKIIWQGKPRFAPFVFPNMFFFLFGIVFAGAAAFGFIETGEIFFLLLPHFWIGILVAFVPPIGAILVHKHMEYVITDRRILIKKGIIGRDFDTVDFEKLQDLSVNVGLIDKIFGTGSIVSSSMPSFWQPKRGPPLPGNVFQSIESPYDVYKLLKDYAFNVKTDIYYPNKYRPKDNPGYGTRYTK